MCIGAVTRTQPTAEGGASIPGSIIQDSLEMSTPSDGTGTPGEQRILSSGFCNHRLPSLPPVLASRPPASAYCARSLAHCDCWSAQSVQRRHSATTFLSRDLRQRCHRELFKWPHCSGNTFTLGHPTVSAVIDCNENHQAQ